MSGTLPLWTDRLVAQVLVRLGWEIARQKAGHPATLSVPDHAEVARGTLRSLLRKAGISAEEFLAGGSQALTGFSYGFFCSKCS